MEQYQAKIDLKMISILAGGDILAFLLFVWIGRSSHALSIFDVAAVVQTAAPFIIGWFIAAPGLGLFRAAVNASWRTLVPRLLIAWLLIGGPIALILRNLFLGRPLWSIIPSFVIVTMSITTLFLLIWRLGYSWQRQRRNQSQETAGA